MTWYSFCSMAKIIYVSDHRKEVEVRFFILGEESYAENAKAKKSNAEVH